MAVKKKEKPNFAIENFKEINLVEFTDTSFFDNKNVIGLDETGVGDYLTPLVAVGAYVPFENIEKLIKLGVQDSKNLDDKKIENLYPQIAELVQYKMSHLTQKGYNTLSRYLNAHELKMMLHLKSINHLEKNAKVNEDLIIIDKFSTTKSILSYYENLMKSKSLKFFEIEKPVMLVEKAESINVAVAAASIIARYYLLNMMKEQEEELEMKFPLGTNAMAEKAAMEFIEKYGRKQLYNVAKINFKTTAKIDEIINSTKEE